MNRRQDNGGEREGSRAKERDGSGDTTIMRSKNIKLKKGELQVIRVVREDRQVRNGIIKRGSQNGREMKFKKSFSFSTKANEMSPHGLKWLRQRSNIKARGRWRAREDELSEKSVDIF